MNKKFAVYACIWAICLGLFQCMVFLMPIPRENGFWLGYAFINLAFLGQLGCGYTALREDNLKKLFYSLPLITLSYTGLVVMLVVGGVCMAIPALPGWLGAVACLLVLGATWIAIVCAEAAAGAVKSIDEKATLQTAFIRGLCVEAESLMHRAGAPLLKKQCQRVYEALRYADPISNGALFPLEQRIQEEFDALTDGVLAQDLDQTESASRELLALLKERNDKCKMLK